MVLTATIYPRESIAPAARLARPKRALFPIAYKNIFSNARAPMACDELPARQSRAYLARFMPARRATLSRRYPAARVAPASRPLHINPARVNPAASIYRPTASRPRPLPIIGSDQHRLKHSLDEFHQGVTGSQQAAKQWHATGGQRAVNIWQAAGGKSGTQQAAMRCCDTQHPVLFLQTIYIPNQTSNQGTIK